MRYPILTASLIALAIQSSFCQEKDFAWLLGAWKLAEEDAYEIWKVSADGRSLDGVAFRMEGSDTVTTETIRLIREDGVFHYIPHAAGNPAPVDFTVTHYDRKSFVAENPHHDFPKRIAYVHVRENDLDRIQASIDGGGKAVKFLFERIR